MKRIIVVLITLYFGSGFVAAQINLVPNPSFENITSCPGNGSEIYMAPPWFQPCVYSGNTTISSSSDLYNTCSPYWSDGVPINVIGYQFARTGIGYIGIYGYVDTLNIREYIEVPLPITLVANNIYCLTYYVSLANACGIAVSNMGAYFSVDSLLDNTNLKAIDFVSPQIENALGNMLGDTANWMLVSGSFIAAGGEKFMTIGNFHKPANTNTQMLNNGGINRAYYYIDDISVIDCTNAGINEHQDEITISISPNPTSGKFTITSSTLQIQHLKIINLLGEIIFQSEISSQHSEIDVSAFAKGIYFVSVVDEQKNTVNRKIIIQ